MDNRKNIIYPHRHNSDGTHDSICPICYLTIANSENEADLKLVEDQHECPYVVSSVPILRNQLVSQ